MLQLDALGQETVSQPGHALQIICGRRHDVDPAVGVVHPVDGHFVDAQAGALGQHQHFGVEEPGSVFHQRQYHGGHVTPHGLEAALCVGEVHVQRGLEDGVVTAGDDLALGPTHHPRASREAGADGHIAVPGQQRGDEGEQGIEIGRQIDVHVRNDVCVRRQPRLV